MRDQAHDYSLDRRPGAVDQQSTGQDAAHAPQPALMQSAELAGQPFTLLEGLPPGPGDAARAQGLEWQSALEADADPLAPARDTPGREREASEQTPAHDGMEGDGGHASATPPDEPAAQPTATDLPSSNAAGADATKAATTTEATAPDHTRDGPASPASGSPPKADTTTATETDPAAQGTSPAGGDTPTEATSPDVTMTSPDAAPAGIAAAAGGGVDAAPASTAAAAGGGADAAPAAAALDTSDPGALLTSLTAAPPSQLMPTLDDARAASAEALTAQRDATAEQIPELPAPTGMAPRDTEPTPDAPPTTTPDQPTVEVPPPTSPEPPAPDVVTPDLPPPPPQPATQLVEGPAPAAQADASESAHDPQLAESAKSSLAAVQLPAAPAPKADAPNVELAGEADPARMTDARSDAATEVDGARGKATTATRADFGEHAIAPAPDDSTLTATTELGAAPTVDALAAEAPTLPAEMWAGIDADAQAPLAAKLTAERDRYAAGQQQFDSDRDAARADADGKIETLEADARTEQEAARATAQGEVDTARDDWRTEIDQVEADARADAEAAQAEHSTQVEQERTTADAEAAGHLAQAERDAAAKTTDAEKEAAAKKKEGEKESGGFWGWVKSKAKAFIDGIKSAVNAIYDGLRAAVKAVFEAAKALAVAVIDAARKVIVGLIKALGEALKAIVKVALAAFPKLADKFCALIDGAVERATTLVNTIADGLKKAVTAVLDFLASTIDKILSIVQDLYNAAFTLIGMLISGEWREILAGLENLVAAAKTAPGQFETAALEELLGGDLDQPLDPATLIAAGRTPPGMAEGEDIAATGDATDTEMPSPPWSTDNVGVDAVAHDYGMSRELGTDIMSRVGGDGDFEFGHSDDPDRDLNTLLGLDAQTTQQTDGATKAAPTPDDGLSPRERADVKWTLMKQGLAQWWSENWPLVLAGGVLAIGGFIAANILTGGAVLAALPGIMTALGAIFAGVTAVHLAGHVRDYLQKGWAGDTQGGGKSLAKALAAGAVELLTWLTFKVGSVALKGAKTVAKGVAKGAQTVAKGATRAGKAVMGGVRRAGQYVIKQGKVLLKGIAGTALGRGAKRLDDFARGLLGKTRFKGFRIRVRQRRFILEGKINPWVKIAEGKLVDTEPNSPGAFHLSDEAYDAVSTDHRVRQKLIDSKTGSSTEDLVEHQMTKAQRRQHHEARKQERQLQNQELIDKAEGSLHGTDASGRSRNTHGDADHGHRTGEDAHRQRLETGETPGGRKSLPDDGRSGWFHDAETQGEALRKGWSDLHQALNSGSVTSGLKPNGRPRRHVSRITTTREGGFGSVMKAKTSVSGNPVGKPGGGGYVVDTPPALQTTQKATVVWEWVPGENTWRPVTYYPHL